jgi:hypothetical protein
MTQSTNILQELKELKSSLAGISSQNIYSVPDGYFEGLTRQVLDRIKAIEAKDPLQELNYLSPLLNNVSRQMPYSIPVDYFQRLEEKLMQSVRERSDYQTAREELEALSPLLSGLKKQMPYSIPQDYFENLNEGAGVVAKNNSETKVVSISNRKWFRYAAAAVITGVVALAGFLFINNKLNNDPAKSFAKFEKKLDKEIKKTSDKELKEFVQQFTDAGLTGEEKAQTNAKEEMKDLLKDVSDTELKKFLEETADPDAPDNETMPVN